MSAGKFMEAYCEKRLNLRGISLKIKRECRKDREGMARTFNVTGSCSPKLHYMVDITGRLEKIKALVDHGDYFTINRARQYGKTTTLAALARYLEGQYIVIPLDFQLIGDAKFKTEHVFTKAFVNYWKRVINNKKNPISGLDNSIVEEMAEAAKEDRDFAFDDMFPMLSELCDTAEKPVVLMIDEVDTATNNKVFLDFLAQLRGYYQGRTDYNTPTFQSVILAGVTDVKNLRIKIHQQMDGADTQTSEMEKDYDSSPKTNSPWNIATDFLVDMSFCKDDIKGMLEQYEADYHTGMDTDLMAGEIYNYTSGYPFLVSKICKLLDERVAGSEKFSRLSDAWTKEGLLDAVRILLSEKNTLFDSLINKLHDYPELKRTVYDILFGGNRIVYNPDEHWMDAALMFGFAKNDQGTLAIANRIFEVRLYNYFLATAEAQSTEIFRAAAQNKSQFIRAGHLDMRKILEKFVLHFDQIYGDNAEHFDEDEGRRRFLLYLRPIINGTGNYYIEPETRNERRMDVVVDYLGEQFIIELKVWRGNAYNERGEKQLSDYLDYFHLKKGYMLSFNFNKKKNIGVNEIFVGDRILIEAVV